jgi:mannose-6-phosphate isomerase
MTKNRKPLYPLKFEPILKEKIWGGEKIRNLLAKSTGSLTQCGESWEISGVPGNVSVVANGELTGLLLTDLIEEYKEDLLGTFVMQTYGAEFPLLIKFIDAADDLSIQVHPNDDLARERHNSLGKTEMWYIMQADENSTLISGFNRELGKNEFLQYFRKGAISEIINKEEAKRGDVFFIPAGRIHTIGKGLLLAEIQQTSDVTYRIYDFDRVDASGEKRELHLEESLDALDYTHYNDYRTHYREVKNQVNNVVTSKFFTTNKLILDRPFLLDKSSNDSFTLLICVGGSGTVNGLDMKMGECVLIPASMGEVRLEPIVEFELLETYLKG